jgi:hypothetical protein
MNTKLILIKNHTVNKVVSPSHLEKWIVKMLKEHEIFKNFIPC